VKFWSAGFKEAWLGVAGERCLTPPQEQGQKPLGARELPCGWNRSAIDGWARPVYGGGLEQIPCDPSFDLPFFSSF
jgi:hypothetical protein